MRTYDEICKSIGYDRRVTPPELVTHWVYYDQGKVIPCSSKFEAMKHSMFDELVTPESKKIHDEFFDKLRAKEQEAREIFIKELREKHSELSNELFDVCYSEAYDRGHHYGYGEIANYLADVVEFAKLVRKIK